MKWFLTIFGIITLSAGLIVGFYEHYYVMLISFFAFIGLLITANLDRLKFFRATRSGVEAETREIIDEAKNTIAELQLLARNIGALTLSLVKRSGRFGGYDGNEKIPSPEILRAFIAKHNLINQEIDEYLKDYEYFRAHKKHRRPEVWQKRQYWGHLKA